MTINRREFIKTQAIAVAAASAGVAVPALAATTAVRMKPAWAIDE